MNTLGWKYSKTQDSVYCAPCRFFGPYVNCIHIWPNKMSKSTTYLYYIALLNILFLKIYVQKLTCCSWKLGFRGIIFSARNLQECRILHHLPQSSQSPCRKATSARCERVTRLLNRFEYTSFWGSYAPAIISKYTGPPSISTHLPAPFLSTWFIVWKFVLVINIAELNIKY